MRSFEDDSDYKSIKWICWVVCIGMALVEAWSQRQFINEDGISYLDMSDVFLRHNWHLLINPIWSPLYPALIGAVTWLIRPSGGWEVPVVHLLNFIIFLGTLASFEFLMRQVIGVLRPENGQEDVASPRPLPVWTWQLLGYSLFAWSTFGMLWAPRMVTPDLCVAMFVYLDAGLLLSLRDPANATRASLWLGLTLGLGYLTKAILFPLAFVFAAVAFVVIGNWKRAIPCTALTLLVFAAISAPLVIAMSNRVGRPTYSEAGTLNYAWHVNDVGGGKVACCAFYPSASGPPPYLRHPLTLLYKNPDIFAFNGPLPSTYSPRQDMEYWAAGTKVVFNVHNQLQATRENILLLFTDSHVAPMSGLIVASFVVLVMNSNASQRIKMSLRGWPLLVPAIAAIGLYLLVWVEPRYVAPFFVLVSLGLLPGLLLQDSKDAHERPAVWTTVVAIGLILFSALVVAYHVAGFPRGEPRSGMFVQVGESLNTAGVYAGEEVAIIGDSSDGCRWARMARVHIVAQILREDVKEFWSISDPGRKKDIYDAFARTGAKAVIAEDPPPFSDLDEWEQLADTRYYVHFFNGSSLEHPADLNASPQQVTESRRP